ncbi:ClbS/DfsB family four-helix bundle protein [Metakosakonia massiliensis]|uniref:ClbS/DfsB family four-helix bundle protein n=1 Tax=Phytobacter massiliensis TaxID=1485952 RepID=A0A6N3ERT7_9ENTR
MAIPESKDALLAAMRKNADVLSKKLAQLPAEKAFEPLIEGHCAGSTISAAQLVSYLIGWGNQVLCWHAQEAAGETIAFPAEGYKWNELGKLAQKYYADYACINCWAEFIASLEENQRQLIALVERYSDDELYHKPWYGKWTRGRMIQFNSASPYKNASGRLTKLLKSLA